MAQAEAEAEALAELAGMAARPEESQTATCHRTSAVARAVAQCQYVPQLAAVGAVDTPAAEAAACLLAAAAAPISCLWMEP